MTVQTTSDRSNLIRGAHATNYSHNSLSTSCVTFFLVPKVVTSAWYSSFTQKWPADDVIAEGYREMGPANLELANEFAPKVRRDWPDW
jgi:hypothetical protein